MYRCVCVLHVVVAEREESARAASGRDDADEREGAREQQPQKQQQRERSVEREWCLEERRERERAGAVRARGGADDERDDERVGLGE